MHRNQSSLTAVGIAIARRVESKKPEEESINYDPYVYRFRTKYLVNCIPQQSWFPDN